MHAIFYYLLATLALGLLIALHELGHLLAARMLGIRVARYSVGFGPVLFEFKRGETSYVLSALPLGGYTRVVGMDPSEPEVNHPDSYASRSPWQRLWVVAAGPLINELIAVLLVYAVAVVGMPDTAHTVIGRIEPQSAAEQAGLALGDTVLAIDGQPVDKFAELAKAIHGHPGETVVIQVARGAQQLELHAQLGTPPVLGVGAKPRRYGPIDAIPAAFLWTFHTTADTIGGLAVAVLHPGLLQGPLSTVRATAHEAERGLVDLVFTLSLISLGLAVFNALPLPGLDGGRSLFLLYEGITRRKVAPRLEGLIHGVGLLLLLAGIALLTILEIHGK